MEITKGQKPTVSATTYPLEAGGRDRLGKGRAAKIKGSYGCGRSLEITGKDVSIQVLDSVLDCVGGEAQSAVTVDASVQALMPGKKHLSSNPRELHPK